MDTRHIQVFAVLGAALVLFTLKSGLAFGQTFVAGHQVFTAVDQDRDNRELLTNIWYPVDAAAAESQPPIQYYQHYNDGDDFWWYDSPFEGGVQDAPASDEGPFPLVVLSHGNGGYANSFSHLGEALARAGYVTVAPRHSGNSWGTPDDSNNQRRSANRGIDLSFITTEVLERNSVESDILFGAIDETLVAAGGYSAGVPTATSLLLGTNSNGSTVPVDNRIKALFLLDGRLWWSSSSRTVDVPIMLIGGTVGNVTSLEQFNIQSTQRHTLHVENSHHWSFGMNLCQYGDALRDSGAPDEVYSITGDPDAEYTEDFWPGCQDHLIDLDESLEVVSGQAISFFDAYLKDGDPAQLLPANLDSLQFNTSLRRGNANVLLSDPVGRLLGENEHGELIDTFESEETEYRGGGRTQRFSIGENDIVAGDYVITASNATTDVTSLRLTTLVSGDTDGHTATFSVLNEIQLTDVNSVTIPLALQSSALDCNMTGDIDAADLDCVSLVEQRDLVLDELSLLLGDLDLDGEVGFSDFLTLSANFGLESGSYLDGNLDLVDGVGFPDFLELSAKFGHSQISAVPEPSGFKIFAIAGAMVLANRRRNRHSTN